MGLEVRAAANATDHYRRVLVVRARDHLAQTVEVLELHASNDNCTVVPYSFREFMRTSFLL